MKAHWHQCFQKPSYNVGAIKAMFCTKQENGIDDPVLSEVWWGATAICWARMVVNPQGPERQHSTACLKQIHNDMQTMSCCSAWESNRRGHFNILTCYHCLEIEAEMSSSLIPTCILELRRKLHFIRLLPLIKQNVTARSKLFDKEDKAKVADSTTWYRINKCPQCQHNIHP